MDEVNVLYELDAKLDLLLNDYSEKKEQCIFLEEELKKTKQLLKEEKRLGLNYKEEFDRLKLVNAIIGGKENKQLMKIKLNKLIREVDSCISQLKNT